MVFGAVGDTPYNIVLLLHVLTAAVAFSPLFVYPALLRHMSSSAAGDPRHLHVALLVNLRRLFGPALIITGLLGFALSGMSDRAYSITDDWLMSSIILWVLMIGVYHAVIVPALRTLSSGQPQSARRTEAYAAKRLRRAATLLTVLLVVQLWLMIFKPGI